MKTGFDVQVEAAYTGLFDRQYFSLSPYLQTDFLDEARIGGINLAWEPVQHLIFLGQGRPINDYIGGFWQLRAEADLLQVDKTGLTNLALGQHDWMGATARAYVYFFPIASEHNWPSWLLNRISFIGTAQFFRDTVTGQNIHYYSAALQYALSSSIAVSFEYDTGTTKDNGNIVDRAAWNFATLASSREHAPTANSCNTEYRAMSLLVGGDRVIRNQVRSAVVSFLGTYDPLTLPKRTMAYSPNQGGQQNKNPNQKPGQ